jgi:hypothetical protein
MGRWQSERLTRCPVNENVQNETTSLPSTFALKKGNVVNQIIRLGIGPGMSAFAFVREDDVIQYFKYLPVPMSEEGGRLQCG